MPKLKIILTTSTLAAVTGALAQNQPATSPPATQTPQNNAAQQKMQELQRAQAELRQVQTTLAPIQKKAAEKPKVEAAYEKLEETYYETMAEKAPELEQQIEALQKLTDELRDNEELQEPAEGRSEEVNAKLEQYQRLKQQLTPVEQQALRDPAITEVNQKYQTTLRTAMVDVDPKARELIEQQEELSQRVTSIQREIQQQQMRRQQSPPQREQSQPPRSQP